MRCVELYSALCYDLHRMADKLNLVEKSRIMDSARMKRAISRLASEIVEENQGADDLYIVGIRRRGVPIAERIAERISQLEGEAPLFGIIDQPYIGERFIGGFGDATCIGPRGRSTLRTRGPRPLTDAFLFSTFPEVGTESERLAFRRVADRVRLTAGDAAPPGCDATVAAVVEDAIFEGDRILYELRLPMMGDARLPSEEELMIRHQFHQSALDLDQWARLAAAVLARVSRGAALVTTLTPDPHRSLCDASGRLRPGPLPPSSSSRPPGSPSVCPPPGARSPRLWPPGRRSCIQCGSLLTPDSGRTCPTCGSQVASGATFCGKCGTRL